MLQKSKLYFQNYFYQLFLCPGWVQKFPILDVEGPDVFSNLLRNHNSAASTVLNINAFSQYTPGMLMRPAGHEAKAEARKSEDEAEAQKFFRGRGHNV